ncbi:MAG: glycosyltransferase family 2 protein [Proteobacteria bacterium]|nr:glycosyltransferase family 2 protein [Pseudomonadota bacterium]
MPAISVVMPVYNAMPYLPQAVESLLRQHFTDFELIAVDDASTDGSAEYLASLADARLVLLRNESNMGAGPTRNRALDAARGDYIAFMDADDISAPTRLAAQLAYLQSHPDAVAVSCNARIMGGHWHMRFHYTSCNFLFGIQLLGPTVMLRADVLRRHGLRFPALGRVQDSVFIYQLSRHGRIHNLPQYHYEYRVHGHGSGRKAWPNMLEGYKAYYTLVLGDLLGRAPTQHELDCHIAFAHGRDKHPVPLAHMLRHAAMLWWHPRRPRGTWWRMTMLALRLHVLNLHQY